MYQHKSDPVIHEMIENFYSEKQKHANKQRWFSNYMQYILSLSRFGGGGKIDNLLTLSDAYHNKLTPKSIVDYCGDSEISSLNMKVEDLIHDDILSGKIKIVQGLELRKRNPQKILAINARATSRKQEKHNKLLKEYVQSYIMEDILKDKAIEEQKSINPKMTSDEQNQIKKQIEEKYAAMKPKDIDKYMAREYKDPAEVQANQMANYIKKDNRWDFLTSNGWKEATISGYEIYLPEIVNNKVKISLIKGQDFDFEGRSSSPYIHDASWQIARYKMSLSEVANKFRLSKKEIKKLTRHNRTGSQYDPNLVFNFESEFYSTDYDKMDVYHAVWRAPIRIGFLTYIDQESGQVLKMKVSEDYVINHDIGDISLEWEYIHIPYEGWILPDSIYKNMKVSDNSLLDSNDPWSGAMPYVGMIYDEDYTGEPTSILSRGMYHQLMFDVFSTKLNNILKSDKGKKLVININSIPKSKGIGLKKFFKYSEENDVIFVNPNEEGNKGLDVTNMVKTVDLSLLSDIQKYMMLLDFTDRRCGEVMGINKSMQGDTGKDPVFNTKQAVASSANIIEPYRSVHAICKDVLLERSIELMREVVRRSDDSDDFLYLQFVLDDMSTSMVKLDKKLITSNNYGVFSADTTRASEIFESLVQLSHAAMQTQTANFSDVTAVLMSESIFEAKEILEAAERRKDEQAQQAQQAQQDAQEKSLQAQRKHEVEQHEREKELIILKEQEKRKTVEKAQLLQSLGFSKDKDLDNDGVPDLFEVYKHNVDTEFKIKKLSLDERKQKEAERKNKVDENLKRKQIDRK